MTDEMISNKVMCDLTVSKIGNSKVLAISRQCRQLGIKEGDIVRVTIERISE